MSSATESGAGKGTKIMRWIAVPIALALILAATVGGGQWIVTLVDSGCGPENMIGGACVEPWHTGAVENVIYIAVVIAALAITIIPATIAPDLKRTVAVFGALLLVGLTGSLYYFTRWPEFVFPSVIAALTAIVGIVWIWTRRTKNAAT